MTGPRMFPPRMLNAEIVVSGCLAIARRELLQAVQIARIEPTVPAFACRELLHLHDQLIELIESIAKFELERRQQS